MIMNIQEYCYGTTTKSINSVMEDRIVDQSLLEGSGRSLNHLSWAPPEENEKTDPDRRSPLLKKKKSDSADGSAQRPSSYSAVQDSDREEDLISDARHALISRKNKISKCQHFGWVEWFFMTVAIFSMINIMGMSIERFVHIRSAFDNSTADFNTSGSGDAAGSSCNRWSCLNDFIFGVVVLVNLVFSIYYFLDGLLREKPLAMIGYAVTMFIISTYVIVNYFIEGEQDDVVKLVRFVLVILLGPLNVCMALVVQHRMGYLILNTLGINHLLTRAYHCRSLFLTMQTCNIQILTNVLVFSWVKDGHFSSTGELIALPLLVVFMVFTSVLGWAAVTWEIKIMAIIWSLLTIPGFGYYPYKIVHIAAHWSCYKEVFTDYYYHDRLSSHTHFLYIAIVLLFACVLGLLTGLVLSILMMTALLNFGNGLKEKIPPPCCAEEQCEYNAA